MEQWLLKTAWPMSAPAPYSTFHICITAAGIVLGAFTAYCLARYWNHNCFTPILFLCGLVLAGSELYKQLFLYYVVNSHNYDWWYFPFQLCSLPMYLCLLYPLIPPAFKNAAATFMQDFGILGGIMALAEPSGLLHPYWTLTLHGLLWHIFLIMIGLYIAFCRQSIKSIRGYGKVLPLFFLFSLIATAMNIVFHPLGIINMFYISPFYPCPQIIFSGIAQKLGNIPGNLVYLCFVCLGGFLCHCIIIWMIPAKKALQE